MIEFAGVFSAVGARGCARGWAGLAASAAGALLLQGCASMNVGYEAETTVRPSGTPGEYVVVFNIYENLIGNRQFLVSSPRLKVREGREGEVTLGDELSSIKCGALIQRGVNATTATVHVRIERGDRRIWTTRQTVVCSQDSTDR